MTYEIKNYEILNDYPTDLTNAILSLLFLIILLLILI
jgi:hypothetical protein